MSVPCWSQTATRQFSGEGPWQRFGLLHLQQHAYVFHDETASHKQTVGRQGMTPRPMPHALLWSATLPHGYPPITQLLKHAVPQGHILRII